MRIIISPAKRMRVDRDSFPVRALPHFLDRTEVLMAAMQAMDAPALQKLWKCNAQIAALNIERLAHMDLRHGLTPAIFSYEGIQYRYMAPGVFTDQQLEYIQEHLRILSGFYGVLRPFDGVTPYRLEMQAKLKTCEVKDLYTYWGAELASYLSAETDCIVNLASEEYSRCVSCHLPAGVRFVTCVFGERRGDRILEKGTLCKMARGEMVRFMAENNVKSINALQSFERLGYSYIPEESAADTLVFLKEGS